MYAAVATIGLCSPPPKHVHYPPAFRGNIYIPSLLSQKGVISLREVFELKPLFLSGRYLLTCGKTPFYGS